MGLTSVPEEPTVDGYLRGQTWSREEPPKGALMDVVTIASKAHVSVRREYPGYSRIFGKALVLDHLNAQSVAWGQPAPYAINRYRGYTAQLDAGAVGPPPWPMTATLSALTVHLRGPVVDEVSATTYYQGLDIPALSDLAIVVAPTETVVTGLFYPDPPGYTPPRTTAEAVNARASELLQGQPYGISFAQIAAKGVQLSAGYSQFAEASNQPEGLMIFAVERTTGEPKQRLKNILNLYSPLGRRGLIPDSASTGNIPLSANAPSILPPGNSGTENFGTGSSTSLPYYAIGANPIVPGGYVLPASKFNGRYRLPPPPGLADPGNSHGLVWWDFLVGYPLWQWGPWPLFNAPTAGALSFWRFKNNRFTFIRKRLQVGAQYQFGDIVPGTLRVPAAWEAIAMQDAGGRSLWDYKDLTYYNALIAELEAQPAPLLHQIPGTAYSVRYAVTESSYLRQSKAIGLDKAINPSLPFSKPWLL